MSSKTIDARLWAACASSYHVGHDGPRSLDGIQPYNDWVGFVDDPMGIVDNIHAYNAILVGTTESEIVVACRGTIPFDDNEDPIMERVSDWCVDFHAKLVTAPGIAGRVHEGFLGTVDSLWAPLCDEIASRQAKSPGLPVYFTGHSKGGGMAPLAAYRWSMVSAKKPLVITFGGARCGDLEFAEDFNRSIALLRYENREDIVPHLPPDLGFLGSIAELTQRLLRIPNYCSVGNLLYVQPDGTMLHASGQAERDLAAARHARIEAMIRGGQFDKLRHDHMIWRTGGYQKAVCPEAV